MVQKLVALAVGLLCMQGAWAADSQQSAGYRELVDGWQDELSCTLEFRPQSRGGGVKAVWSAPLVSVSEEVYLGATFSCNPTFRQHEVVIVDSGDGDGFYAIIGDVDSPSAGTFRVCIGDKSHYYFEDRVKFLGKIADEDMRLFAKAFIKNHVEFTLQQAS